MKLNKKAIAQIEGILQPGKIVEVHLNNSGQMTVHQKAGVATGISIIPVLADEEEPTVLELIVKKIGYDPVSIAQVHLPSGFYITGITGNQK